MARKAMRRYSIRVVSVKTLFALACFCGLSAQSSAAAPDPEFAMKLSAEELAWLRTAPRIRFTGDPDWLPVEAFDDQGNYTGIVSELLQTVAAKTGIEFELVPPGTWTDALRLASEDAIDVISGDTSDAARLSEKFDAVRPYMTSNVLILARAGHPGVNHLAQLRHKRVGVVQDYGYTIVLRTRHPGMQFTIVESVEAALIGVREGELDAVLVTDLSARYKLQFPEYEGLDVIGHTSVFSDVTFIVTQRQPMLRSILEKALFDIPFQQRDAIFDRWIRPDGSHGATLAPLALSKDERAWLDAHPNIRFVSDPNWLPYEAFDADGNYIGIVADQVRLIEQLLGIRFEIVRTDSWSESLQMARDREADVITASVKSVLGREMRFSAPYVTTMIAVVMDRDHDFVSGLGELSAARIGVIRDYAYLDQVRAAYPALQLVEFNNLDEGLGAVSTREVDAMLCALSQCAYNISRLGLDNIRVVGRTDLETTQAMAVQRDLEPLVPLINRALEAIGPERQQHIRAAWSKDPLLDTRDLSWLYRILAVALIVALGGAIWNWRLGRVVRERGRVAKALTTEKREAVAANMAKSEFLASVSHEVRTPMSGMLGMLEVVSRSGLTDQQAQKVGAVRESAKSLLRIIDDLLDLVRIEGGNLSIVEEVTRLDSLIESVVTPFIVSAHEKSVQLRLRIDPRMTRSVVVDPVRIRQILSNLLSNAIKFTESGSVTLVAAVVEDAGDKLRFRLCVEDTGIGISKENLETLFTRHVQAHDVMKYRFDGSGLGLSICKELAELLGGTLQLESELGSGTRATYEQRVEIVATPAAAVGNGVRGSRAVLAVDDEFCRAAAQSCLDTLNVSYSEPPTAADIDALCAETTKTESDFLITDLAELVAVCHIGDDEVEALAARFSCPIIVLSSELQPSDSIIDARLSVIPSTPLLSSSVAMAVRACLDEGSAQRHSVEQETQINARVLIVEDNPMNQRVLTAQLETIGCSCVIANNGQEGLDAWREGGFGIIVTDCTMPVMDGYEMTEVIRREEAGSGKHIPIIGLTASSSDTDVDRQLSSGMNECIAKPAEIKEIRSVLNHWLNRR